LAFIKVGLSERIAIPNGAGVSGGFNRSFRQRLAARRNTIERRHSLFIKTEAHRGRRKSAQTCLQVSRLSRAPRYFLGARLHWSPSRIMVMDETWSFSGNSVSAVEPSKAVWQLMKR